MVTSLASCESGPTLPEVEVRAQLDWIEAPRDRHDQKLAIHVTAALIGGPALDPGEFVSVAVRSSAGHTSLVRLESAYCSDGEEVVLCRELWVWLKDGHDLLEIGSLLESLNAQLIGVALSSPIGRIYAFGDTGSTIDALRNHAAVRVAEPLSLPLAPIPSPLADYRRSLSGAIRTSVGTEGPDFSLNAGDTITTEYDQPDGSRLIVQARVVRCVNLLTFCPREES